MGLLIVYCMQPLENWAFCPAGHSNATLGFICNYNELSKCPFPTESKNLKKNMIKKWSGMTYDIVTVWPCYGFTCKFGCTCGHYLYCRTHSKQVNAVNCHIYIKAVFLDKYWRARHLRFICYAPFSATKWLMTLVFTFIKWGVGVMLAILLLGSLNGTILTINKE